MSRPIPQVPMSSSALLQLTTQQYGSPALINPGPEPGQLLGAPPEEDDGLPRKGSHILMAALEEFDEALPRYMEAEVFYEGDAGDNFASEKIQMLLAKSGVEVVEDFNYAKIPVDTIADKLQIRSVTVGAGDESNTEEDDDEDSATKDDSETTSPGASKSGKKAISERAQEKLDEIRKRNQMDIEEGDLLLKASEYGDAYLFVWPVVQAPADDLDAFEGGIPVDQEHGGKVISVDMFVNSPTAVRIFYDPENPLRPSHAIKTWEWDDPDTDMCRDRATLYFLDTIERWVTKAEKGADKARPESWVPYVVEGQEWPAPNPYKRLPFFHFRTKRIYGIPEHKSAYGPQRLINKLVSAHAVTIDYQSFPQRYALSNPKMDDVLGNLIDPDNPEDDDDDPEGSGGRSQLRADPSAVWKLPGITSVGQFSPADPSVFMDPLERYIKSMAELTGTPLDRFVGYATPPSGESRKASNEVLYEKAGTRRSNYGGTLSDAYEWALELMGEKDIEVTVQWKPVEMATGAEDWNVVQMKIANGVPVKQALVEAGYPDDQVEEWLLDETGASLIQRVAILNSIGTAIQSIGAGVALGIVDPEQAGGIVAKVLGLVGEDLPALEEPVNLRPVQENAAAMAQMGQMGAATAAGGGGFGGGGGAPGDTGANAFGDDNPAPETPPPPKPVQVGHK